MTLSFGVLAHITLQVITAARALSRRDRQPASRAAWLLLIAALPFVGIVFYFLFGETKIGGRTAQRMANATRRLGHLRGGKTSEAEIPAQFRQVFRRAVAVNGFRPLAGNTASLPPDENAEIAALIADIDAARDHVHLLFYIWLEDGNGLRVLDAVERAAARGVTCRLLIDGLGSRRMARSARWRRLGETGVKTAITFKMRWLLFHIFFARIDLRNHRKIAVIDGRTGYCGSQNCADPEFRVKAKYAPWIDTFLRIEGPVVGQLQHIFAIDWMTHGQEDISAMLDDPVPADPAGFPAIVVGSGPTVDNRAVSDLFALLLASAEDEVIITTPYFVPDDTLQRAIHGAALRGVNVTLILPERNDSFFVARASRSYYPDLLRAGVRIAEYRKGLLHAKTLTVDGRAACIGSANMDRRSFELNFENNLILASEDVTGLIRTRQLAYLSDARELACEEVETRHWITRMVDNLFATMGPLL
ncbi:cardiolipin synthase [Defluviimonas sp. SAOS-178_SWC]|uniref:cardiolipin synthase n=1 Tax=Defluviimonas sp. SAOS-178_SWC TaxID=3121287 RepID=UPI003222192B